MSQRREPTIRFNTKKLLIELNLAIDFVKGWSDRLWLADRYTTLFLVSAKRPTPQVVTDILILEDRRFFKHKGVDWRAAFRAIKRKWRYGRFGGVSTIEQQLVRTIFQRHERTFHRKSRELALAVLVNFHVSKSDILGAYLNSVYFGPRLYGIDVASEVIFGRSASHLDSQQSALIASLLPYPVPPALGYVLRKARPKSLSAEDFLQIAEKTHPKWVKRIRKRMNYLERLRPTYSEVVWRGFQR